MITRDWTKIEKAISYVLNNEEGECSKALLGAGDLLIEGGLSSTSVLYEAIMNPHKYYYLLSCITCLRQDWGVEDLFYVANPFANVAVELYKRANEDLGNFKYIEKYGCKLTGVLFWNEMGIDIHAFFNIDVESEVYSRVAIDVVIRNIADIDIGIKVHNCISNAHYSIGDKIDPILTKTKNLLKILEMGYAVGFQTINQ